MDIGLRSVFEIIRESRSAHPVLCTKALFAILDVLQGQQPDGLKGEPIDIIGMQYTFCSKLEGRSLFFTGLSNVLLLHKCFDRSTF